MPGRTKQKEKEKRRMDEREEGKKAIAAEKVEEKVEDDPVVMQTTVETAGNLVSVIRTLLKYALDNLHLLIFDENGNVVWPEAARRLLEVVGDREDLTDEEYQIAIILALDGIIMEKSYDDLDRMIKKLPFGLRALLATAEGGARTYLRLRPDFKDELINGWDKLIMGFTSNRVNPEFAYLQEAFANAPHIRAWLQGYVLRKLKISAEDIAHAKSQSSQGAGQGLSGEGVPAGPQVQRPPGGVDGTESPEGVS